MKRLFLLLIVTAATFGWAQAGERPQILVIGTYHMANPGHDTYNVKADDVLAPERQQQIAELLAVLKKFRPTKIAVESDANSDRAPRQYADYLAGKYTLSRNEIDQVGYRLAKELGHKTVYAVDADGDFPIMRVKNYAKANGREAECERVMSQWETLSKELGEFQHTHTVLETLAYLNADERVGRDMAPYYELVAFGEPWEYAGSDLLASWYQRNIRIYRNIRALAGPGERVLVIYGFGHLGWLRQDIAGDPAVELKRLSDLTAQP
jgi:hypothetical protein